MFQHSSLRPCGGEIPGGRLPGWWRERGSARLPIPATVVTVNFYPPLVLILPSFTQLFSPLSSFPSTPLFPHKSIYSTILFLLYPPHLLSTILSSQTNLLHHLLPSSPPPHLLHLSSITNQSTPPSSPSLPLLLLTFYASSHHKSTCCTPPSSPSFPSSSPSTPLFPSQTNLLLHSLPPCPSSSQTGTAYGVLLFKGRQHFRPLCLSVSRSILVSWMDRSMLVLAGID
ncbi:hypothetical protein Pcinc_010535 [Petrolisthes cinctipes]|uniref:Uncharacterized protein n=1 Tax=Petrolisthes cinctipes TaxID=88211 RepID=A0AAE1KUF2_PETCI|nr:hypothetical protein Pcinc_010535 [Petrolisthes cinctipes]